MHIVVLKSFDHLTPKAFHFTCSCSLFTHFPQRKHSSLGNLPARFLERRIIKPHNRAILAHKRNDGPGKVRLFQEPISLDKRQSSSSIVACPDCLALVNTPSQARSQPMLFCSFGPNALVSYLLTEDHEQEDSSAAAHFLPSNGDVFGQLTLCMLRCVWQSCRHPNT